MEQLLKQGYASRKELSPYIASSKKEHNDFLDMQGETITTNDGSVWELIPEDGIFELKTY